jgi:2-hydroxy-3-oxopropionate reductase
MVQMERLGWIGLGSMGLPMARNLQRKGFQTSVVGHSRREPVELMKQIGSDDIVSPKELAENCGVIFLMVFNDQQTQEVVFGENGLAKGLTRDHILVVCSTLTLHFFIELAERIKNETGAAVLDAPVSGFPWGAEAATLSFMVGGDETTYLKCRPYFEAMGKQIYHVGSKIGSGLAVKLANNLMLVVNAGAALEAVALASKSGVDTPKLFEIVKSSTGDSYVVRNWDNLMNLFNTYPDINKRAHKDLEYALDFAHRIGLHLPLAELASQTQFSAPHQQVS